MNAGLSDDFELNNLDKWITGTVGGGGIGTATAARFAGNYGMRITGLTNTGDDAYIEGEISNQNYIHGQTMIRFSQNFDVNTVLTGFINAMTNTTSCGCALQRLGDGTYRWQTYARTSSIINYSGAFVMVPGQWYKLDFYALAGSSSNGSLRLLVDNKQVLYNVGITTADGSAWTYYAYECDCFGTNTNAGYVDFDNVFTESLNVFFHDDFENGISYGFTLWTSEAASGGTSSVVTGEAAEGRFSAQFDITGANWYAAYRKTLTSDVAEAYYSAVVKVNALPTANGTYYTPIEFDDSGSSHLLAAAIVYNNAGTVVWGVRVKVGGVNTNYLSTVPVTINTNVRIELYLKIDGVAGAAKLWIGNSTETSPDVSATDIDTNDWGNIFDIWLGDGDGTTTIAHKIYGDAVIVADSYIGQIDIIGPACLTIKRVRPVGP